MLSHSLDTNPEKPSQRIEKKSKDKRVEVFEDQDKGVEEDKSESEDGESSVEVVEHQENGVEEETSGQEDGESSAENQLGAASSSKVENAKSEEDSADDASINSNDSDDFSDNDLLITTDAPQKLEEYSVSLLAGVDPGLALALIIGEGTVNNEAANLMLLAAAAEPEDLQSALQH